MQGLVGAIVTNLHLLEVGEEKREGERRREKMTYLTCLFQLLDHVKGWELVFAEWRNLVDADIGGFDQQRLSPQILMTTYQVSTRHFWENVVRL